jgi:biotin-dependent carboxylase-like uncharacterized protein
VNHLRVTAPGPLTTVQDLGRPGYAHLGVPPSGALDPDALRLANRLVGNPETAAGLETTFGGLAIVLDAPRYLALTGAPAPPTVDGRPAPLYAPFHVPAGARVRLAAPRTGVRSYLAVGGGVTVAPVLGSRATDLLAGLGPAALAAGDVVPLGEPTDPPSTVDSAPAWSPGDGTIRLYPGPRVDWFTDAALDLLTSRPYLVTTQSNRIGLRLAGPVLPRCRTDELPSEGLVTGAVQVPANGQPVVFLADHPTTGGYPVIGVVDPRDLAIAAQARPGSPLAFRLVPNRTYRAGAAGQISAP